MDYKSRLKYFLKNCNEKEKEIAYLKKILKDHKFKSLLDIGPGTGVITNSIKNHFSEIHVIEKNKHFIKDYIDLRANIHISNFEDVFIDRKFELIIACHILPYLRNKKFHNNMDKIFNLLSENGTFVSFEMTTEGDIGIIKESVLNKRIKTTYEYLVEYLRSKQINFYEKKIKVNVRTKHKEEMYQILSFFSEKYIDRFNAHSIFVKRYIKKKLYNANNESYELNYYNKMITTI